MPRTKRQYRWKIRRSSGSSRFRRSDRFIAAAVSDQQTIAFDPCAKLALLPIDGGGLCERWRRGRLPGTVRPKASDGGILAGASIGSASAAFAGGEAARSRQQARARLS